MLLLYCICTYGSSSLHNDFPSQRTGAQHGSFCIVELADEHLCLALVDFQHVFVISASDGFHDEVAGLGEPAEEDECLGAVESRKVGTCSAQYATRVLKYFLSHLVTFSSSDAHVLAFNLVERNVTQQGGFIGVGYDFACRASHACG